MRTSWARCARRSRMILRLRHGLRVAVDHIGGEMHKLTAAALLHYAEQVPQAVRVHRPEVLSPLRFGLDWGKRPRRHIVDDVRGLDPQPGDGPGIGDIDLLKRYVLVHLARTALHVSDQHLLAHHMQVRG